MKIPQNTEDGADLTRDLVRVGEREDSLFGDSAWIEEHLDALRGHTATCPTGAVLTIRRP